MNMMILGILMLAIILVSLDSSDTKPRNYTPTTSPGGSGKKPPKRDWWL